MIYFIRISDTRGMDMYKYGNKSSFDFDQGLKVLLKTDNEDDFFYNMPSLGAIVSGYLSTSCFCKISSRNLNNHTFLKLSVTIFGCL